MLGLTAESFESGDCVWLTTDPDVVTARERGRALARSLGFSSIDQASVETTISELATTLLTYARSGEIVLEVVSKGGSTGLRVVARDWCPAEERLELPSLLREADDLDVQHRAGRGTVVSVTKWLGSRSAAPDDYGRMPLRTARASSI